MTDAIVIEGVRKTFGSKVAVDRMDLRIPSGTLCGFIGPNGAGKTTTMRMVMSIIMPDEGRISVLGKKSAIESKDRIGYLPEERGLYRKMKVKDFLDYMGRLKGLKGADLSRRISTWLDRVGLGDCAKKKCEELSKGMQQKVQFLAAIMHEPELVILDEPFSGLDPVNSRLVRGLIDELHKAGRTLIFSTHVMEHAEQICDSIVMIHQGRKVLDADVRTIRSSHDPRAIVCETLDPDAGRVLAGVAGVDSVTERGGLWELTLREGAKAPEVIRDVARAAPVVRVEQVRPTLEDVFVRIVDASGAPADAETLRQSLRAGEGSGQ